MTPDEVKRLVTSLRESADEVESFPHPSHCDHLHVAFKVMRAAADMLDALAGQAVPAQPVAWRIRETNPEYPEPGPWHYREQSERPYCSWKYHEMQPLYASPQAAQPDTQEKPERGTSLSTPPACKTLAWNI